MPPHSELSVYGPPSTDPVDTAVRRANRDATARRHHCGEPAAKMPPLHRDRRRAAPAALQIRAAAPVHHQVGLTPRHHDRCRSEPTPPSRAPTRRRGTRQEVLPPLSPMPAPANVETSQERPPAGCGSGLTRDLGHPPSGSGYVPCPGRRGEEEWKGGRREREVWKEEEKRRKALPPPSSLLTGLPVGCSTATEVGLGRGDEEPPESPRERTTRGRRLDGPTIEGASKM